MPFKIRTKLIIAFFAVIFPFLLSMGVIAIYNLNIIYKGIQRIEDISNEMQTVMGMELALDRVLMPGNDYVITGGKRYIDDFKMASADVEGRLKEIEAILGRMKETPEIKEEREKLKDVRTAWRNIKETSQKIFEIPNPVGNKDASNLMEEMDYKWAYPAIEKLKRWEEIDREEYREAHERSEEAWKQAWLIMIAGSLALLGLGVFFSLFYSRLFARPIEAIHNGADKIATGDFKTRLDIKTGDEIEQLSNAMNEMAAQLDNFYADLGKTVEELRLYEEIISQMEEGVYLIRASDGVIVYANPKFEEMFGYDPGEMVGKHVSIVNAPAEKSPEDTAKEISEALNKTGVWSGEILNIKKEGTPFWCYATVATFEHHKYGTVWVSIHHDITERKKAEEELEKLNQELEKRVEERTGEISALLKASRAVMEHSRNFTDAARAVFDIAKEVIGAEAGYVALMSENGRRNEVLFLVSGGRPCTVDPNLPMPIRGLRETAYRTGAAVYENNFSNSEWMKFMPAGHAALENVLFAPLMIEGKAVGLIGIANKPGGFDENDAKMLLALGDIAAIGLSESRLLGSLQESEERFRAVAESASDAIICLKAPDTIYLWNRKAEEMFGYTADEVTGRGLHDIIVPERYRGKSREGLGRFFETGAGPVVGKTVEIEGLRKDGTEFPVELSISAMNIRGVWHASGIIRDITEHKKAEKKIAEQLDYLERFEKVAVKREFRIKELRDENEALKVDIEGLKKRKVQDAT